MPSPDLAREGAGEAGRSDRIDAALGRSHDQSGQANDFGAAFLAIARPPAPIPVQQSPAARRIAGVQRALSEYGYGNLKITGAMGAETQSAIQKFEREHKMQVTGQVSDRLLRELGAAIGHPVE